MSGHKLVLLTPNIAIVPKPVCVCIHFTSKVLPFCKLLVHVSLRTHASVRARLYMKRAHISIQAQWIILRRTCRTFHSHAFFSPSPLALLFRHFHRFSVPRSLALGVNRTSGEPHNKGIVRGDGRTAAHLRSSWTVKLTSNGGPAASWGSERDSGNRCFLTPTGGGGQVGRWGVSSESFWFPDQSRATTARSRG